MSGGAAGGLSFPLRRCFRGYHKHLKSSNMLERLNDLGVGEDAHDIDAPADFLLSRQPEEGQGLFDGILCPTCQARIARRPFGEPCGEIGPCLSEIAPVIEPAQLLQAVALLGHALKSDSPDSLVTMTSPSMIAFSTPSSPAPLARSWYFDVQSSPRRVKMRTPTAMK
jgi:hypothetical protein